MRVPMGILLRSTAIAATALGGAVLAGAALPAPASAQQLEYAGSVQSATGSYLFTDRTTSVAFLNGLSLEAGRFRVSALLPLLYRNSTAVTYVGGVPVPTGGPDAGAVRQRQAGMRVRMGRASGGASGADLVAEPGDVRVDLGDPLLQAGIDLGRGVGAVRTLGVYAVAKAPLADAASGVGTGEWDYGAGLSLELGAGRTFVLADASYWVVGDMPDLPLRNALWYAANVGRSLGAGAWSVFGSVSGGTAVIDGAKAPLSVGAGLGYMSRSARSLTAGVNFGMTESSPDVSTWVGWRVPLGHSAR